MSKRKRVTKSSTGSDQPAGEESATSAADDAPREDMAHVSPDVLSGSPDIFAPKWTEEPASPAPEAVTEPAATEGATEAATEPIETVALPAESVQAPAETPVETAPVMAPPISSPPPPHYVAPTVRAAAVRSGGSSMALGIVLVVVGLFALGIVVFGIDLTQYGWPLFVIIPGLTLLVVGFLGGGVGASVPGGIVTMLGLVLAYQSSSGDWASWAFTWALVAPGGVGLGLYLQALRDRDTVMLRRGRTLIFIAALIFMIGFVFFESILGISGTDYGIFGKAALPGLLIVIGIILLVRSIQRTRRA
ncbi:MAG: hypothetical protein ACREOY_06105 [Candidatus Dormibacteraceae bacterium]